MKIAAEKFYPTNWSELRGALGEIAALAQVVGLPETDVESFSIALWEALANAVKHGNRGRENRRIWLSYGIESDRLWARVRDEGEGFDLSRVPDPRNEGLLSASGRGILMMRHLCDVVEWSRKGTEVRLVKRCFPRPPVSSHGGRPAGV